MPIVTVGSGLRGPIQVPSCNFKRKQITWQSLCPGALFSIPWVGSHTSYSCFHGWLCQQAHTEPQKISTPHLGWYFHFCWFNSWESYYYSSNLKWPLWPKEPVLLVITEEMAWAKPLSESSELTLFPYSLQYITVYPYSGADFFETTVALHE